tara:strand:- start:295 stop:432 length:138 start_codon:yes stop_codon:yes gene_type:complete
MRIPTCDQKNIDHKIKAENYFKPVLIGSQKGICSIFLRLAIALGA